MATHYRTVEGKARCGNKQARELASTIDDVDCGACLRAIGTRGGNALVQSVFHNGQVALTHVSGGAIYSMPYSDEFLSAFKREIPPESRKWMKDPKGWFVATEHRDKAEELMHTFFGPRSWRKAFQLLSLTTNASPGLVYLARIVLERRHARDPAALEELACCIEALSAYYGEDVLARGLRELTDLGLFEAEKQERS